MFACKFARKEEIEWVCKNILRSEHKAYLSKYLTTIACLSYIMGLISWILTWLQLVSVRPRLSPCAIDIGAMEIRN